MQNNIGFNNVEALRRRRGLVSSSQDRQQAPVSNPIAQCPEKIWSSLDVLSSMNKPFLGKYTIKMADCDGMIGDFKQGTSGDCWFLSGLKALSVTPIGNDIIRNSITKNDDGTITVNFKGANKSYTITEKEFNSAVKGGIAYKLAGSGVHKYSTGDSDVLVLELAMEKLKKDIIDGNVDTTLPNYTIAVDKRDPVTNSIGAQVFSLLTGKTPCAISTTGCIRPDTGEVLQKDNKEKLAEFLEKYNLDNKKYAVTFGTDVNSGVFKDLTGKEYQFLPKHEYAVEGTFGGNIIISNPHDSAKKIIIPQSEFLKLNISVLSYQNLKEDNNPFDKELTDYLIEEVNADNFINEHC
ncbi:MAG: hypothetical protein NC191_03220 [Muribaculaceae bacterium]|nr:hypothetical protein [Muribaculaceae bacterium]